MQSQQHVIADEEFNEDLIMHCWNGVKEQVQRVIAFNKSQGVSNPDTYIGYIYADGSPLPMSVRKNKRFWESITHKRSGKPITINSLLESGRISDMEKDLFGTDKQWPRIELVSMTRVKDISGQEYLMRFMNGIGLSEIGAIVTASLNDCDFTRKVPVFPDVAKLPNGTDVKVPVVGSGEFSYETSPMIFTTPFTKENVQATINKYPPYEEGHGKINYTLKKQGITNEAAVSSLEEFINADFDETFERLRAPAPQININSKDLVSYVKIDRESRTQHKQYS
jgi:hypothetical protein